MRDLITRIAQVVAIALAFAVASYLTQTHKALLAAALGAGGAVGPVAFVLITALLVVAIIPLDLVFLVPLGIALWGPAATALLSITGWVLGSAAAFAIARRYGRPVVVRVIGAHRVEVLERHVPTTNLFWLVVLLRMCVPVDLLSYALGLSSRLPWRSYILATALGVTPFAFFFAYAGTLPLARQLPVVLAGLAAAALMLFVAQRVARRGALQPKSGGDPSRTAL